VAAFAGWTLLAGGAYAFNDLRDEAVDRGNRPRRYLPRGGSRARLARLAGGLAVAGLLALGLGRPALVGLGVAWGALVYGYSLGLKDRAPLAANFAAAVAVPGALAPACSGRATRSLRWPRSCSSACGRGRCSRTSRTSPATWRRAG